MKYLHSLRKNFRFCSPSPPSSYLEHPKTTKNGPICVSSHICMQAQSKSLNTLLPILDKVDKWNIKANSERVGGMMRHVQYMDRWMEWRETCNYMSHQQKLLSLNLGLWDMNISSIIAQQIHWRWIENYSLLRFSSTALSRRIRCLPLSAPPRRCKWFCSSEISDTIWNHWHGRVDEGKVSENIVHQKA